MADEFVPVALRVKIGSLDPAEVQSILDDITRELADPGSEVSRERSKIGVSIEALTVDEVSAFVAETFLIAMAVKFAGGAASAGGVLFFNRVIKPRIAHKRADGVGELIPDRNTDPRD